MSAAEILSGLDAQQVLLPVMLVAITIALALWTVALCAILGAFVWRNVVGKAPSFAKAVIYIALAPFVGVAYAAYVWPVQMVSRYLYTTTREIEFQQSPGPRYCSVKEQAIWEAPRKPIPSGQYPRFAVHVITKGDSKKASHIGFASVVKTKRHGICLMTACHVLEAARTEDGNVRLWAPKTDGGLEEGIGCNIDGKPEVLFASKRLDVVFFKFQDLSMSHVCSVLGRKAAELARHKEGSITVLSPPDKHVDAHCWAHSIVKSTSAFRLRYKASTIPGSSGSPLYNSAGKIVGVHVEHNANKADPWNLGVSAPDLIKYADEWVAGSPKETSAPSESYSYSIDDDLGDDIDELDLFDAREGVYTVRTSGRRVGPEPEFRAGMSWADYMDEYDEAITDYEEKPIKRNHKNLESGNGKPGVPVPPSVSAADCLSSEPSSSKSAPQKSLKKPSAPESASARPAQLFATKESVTPGVKRQTPTLQDNSENGSPHNGQEKPSTPPSNTKLDASSKAKSQRKKRKNGSSKKSQPATPETPASPTSKPPVVSPQAEVQALLLRLKALEKELGKPSSDAGPSRQ